MNKILLAIIFCLSHSFATLHNITDAYIDPRGHSFKITIADMDSAGTHHMGWITGDTLHANTANIKIKLAVKRLGYDTLGARDTLIDTVFGDTVMSRTYPNQMYDSCSFDAGSITFTIPLSADIFAQDTIKNITIGKGFFISDDLADTSNDYTATSMTNNSTETYDSIKVVGNDTRSPRFCTDSSFYVAFAGIHQSARDGLPLEAVGFHAVDNHSNTYDTVVAFPKIDNLMPDSLKILEYVSKINVAGLTKGDSVTVTWKAYPHYGDTLWSGDGVNTVDPTPLYAPRKYYYNEQWVMCIDSTTGNDATGDTVSEDNFSFASPPAYCKTLGGAVNRARALTGLTNLNGRVKFYVHAGGYEYWGATITAGTLSSFNLEFINWPGERPRIFGLSGSTAMPGGDSYLYFKGWLIDHSTGNLFQSERSVILDSCEDSRNGGLTIYTVQCSYLNNCVMDTTVKIPYATAINASLAISRNTRYKTSIDGSVIIPYMFIGNSSRMGTKTGIRFASFITGGLGPKYQNGYIASNYLTSNKCITEAMFRDSSLLHGMALIQNVFENTTGATPLLQIASDDAVSKSVNNVMLFNNTLKGQRMNGPYNDHPLNDSLYTAERKHWVFRNNISDYVSRGVTAWDSHGDVPGTRRVGNFPTIFGTNMRDELIVSAVSTYYPRFRGLNSKFGRITFANDGTMNTYLKVVDDNSYVGSNDGNGDYHLAVGSPAIFLAKEQALLYDLDGNERGLDSGAVGAYAYEGESCTTPTVTKKVIASCTTHVEAKWGHEITGTYTSISIDSVNGHAVTAADSIKLKTGTDTVLAKFNFYSTTPVKIVLKVKYCTDSLYVLDTVTAVKWDSLKCDSLLNGQGVRYANKAGVYTGDSVWMQGYRKGAREFSSIPTNCTVYDSSDTYVKAFLLHSDIVPDTLTFSWGDSVSSDTFPDTLIYLGDKPAPVIDTFICHVMRDSTHGNYCRNGDTLTAHGHNFSTIDTFFQNSTKTVWFKVVQQWDDSALVIPSTGSPRGYYSPILNRSDGIDSARKVRGIRILIPGGL